MTKPSCAGLRTALLSRETEMSFAADDLVSVIRYGTSSSVWREALMETHLSLVIHHAHWENEHVPDSCINLARAAEGRPAATAPVRL